MRLEGQERRVDHSTPGRRELEGAANQAGIEGEHEERAGRAKKNKVSFAAEIKQRIYYLDLPKGKELKKTTAHFTQERAEIKSKQQKQN